MATVQIVPDVTASQALRKGYNGISMTNWTSATAKPLITVGSTLEVGGAIYQVQTADADPDPAGDWAGLAAGIVYIFCNGTAWKVSSTAPTWDTNKQGYYSTNYRCVGQVVKDAGGNWTQKTIYKTREYGECYQGINVGIGANATRRIKLSSGIEIIYDASLNLLRSPYLILSMPVIVETDLNNYDDQSLYALLVQRLKGNTESDILNCMVSGSGIIHSTGNLVIFSSASYVNATTLRLYYFDTVTGLPNHVDGKSVMTGTVIDEGSLSIL